MDVAIILGPGNPPTLAVISWQWLTQGDIDQQTKGALASLLLMLLLAAYVLLSYLDAAQDPYPINHSRPDTHVNEVPVMRSIFHIRAMIGDRKKFNALLFGLGNVITLPPVCRERALSTR